MLTHFRLVQMIPRAVGQLPAQDPGVGLRGEGETEYQQLGRLKQTSLFHVGLEARISQIGRQGWWSGTGGLVSGANFISPKNILSFRLVISSISIERYS